MRRRSLPFLAALAAALVLPAAALGHAEYASSDPVAGSNLDEPPTEVSVTFDGELDPASGFVVTAADGSEVGTGELDLDVAERNVLAGPVSITEPGVYTVTFTAASVDGHVEEGHFEFGYRADVPDDGHGDDGHAAGSEQPDTALSVDTRSPLVPVGVALVVAAAVMGTSRIVEARIRA